MGTFPKTKFSMFLPEVHAKLNEHGIQSVVLFGIEVCFLPVADLLFLQSCWNLNQLTVYFH